MFTYNGAKYKDSMEIREDDGELYHQAVHTDLTVSSWAELQSAVNNSENENRTIGLACDIDARDDNYSIKVDGDNLGESKSITIELCGYSMDRKRDDDTGDGHAISVKDKAKLTVKDSVGTGVITGGNATDGGGIKIEENSTCNLENVTIKGNKADKDGGGIYVWGTLNMTGGNVTGNEAEDEGGGIYVEDTGRLDLDGVTIDGNKADGDGGGLLICLRDSGAVDGIIKNCAIRNNTTDADGGGFSLDADERILEVSNTEVSGNSADSEGGGIYMDGGRLKMNGFESVISNNTAPDGGGVMNYDGTIDFENITISGNKTTEESGGGINNKNNAYLKNVTIKNNKSDDAGGGVYSKSSDMEMRGCRFESNKASGKGGGIFTKEDALIEDCTFRSNKAQKGGAVYLADGDVTIKNPTITQNEVDERGGGIYIEDGDPILDGGSITENKAKLSGGGIYMDDDLKIKGIITVKGNDSNGIYICSGEKLDVTGALYNGDEKSDIAVTMEKGYGVFTKGYPGKNPDKEPFELFSSDPGRAVIKDSHGEGEIAESDWPLLQRLINDTAADVSGGGDIPMLKLDRDWKASDKDVVLTIPEGKSIVIDLAGHTIDRNMSSQDENGNVFQVGSGRTLVIKDSSDGKTGTITGGWAEKGGAIDLQAGASCTIKSGNISGNKANNGGGIYVQAGANLEMSDGSINSNNAISGGGIYMEGGDPDHAAVELTGGIISGNNAEVEAGGIFAGSGSVINVSDQPFVRGNTGSAGKNILLDSENVINITGEFAMGQEGGLDGARLDLAVKGSNGEGEAVKLTSGLSDNLPEGDVTVDTYARAVFTYNEAGFDEYLEVEGDPGELYKKAIDTDDYVWVSDWDELQEAVLRDGEGKVIGLKKDITKSGDDRYKGSLKVTHEAIIDLNGHKLDRDRGDSDSASDDGSVITVEDGGDLTIRDSSGTGTITGGFAVQGGGININRGGHCTIEGGTVCGNRSTGYGGGIYAEESLKMTGGAISNNEALGGSHIPSRGGGIYIKDKTLELQGATISGNKASAEGGGIFGTGLIEHAYTITNCHITDNVSGKEGGGIYVNGNENYGKKLTLDGSEISGNSAEGNGGGIFNYNAIVVMTGGSIANNKGKNGAGIMNEERSITLTGVTISGNSAEDDGGGIYNKDETILKDCEFTGNEAGDNGAGLYTFKSMDITGGKFSENRAGKDGGGICIKQRDSFLAETTRVSLTGAEFSGNRAGGDGGGIAVCKSTELHLTACKIDENDAEKDGGGIYVGNSSVLTIDGGSVSGNSTGEYGGGIFVNEYADTISIRGALKISDNLGGSDIYLDGKKKLKVKGSLAEGDQIANIGVFTETGTDKDFTDGYSDHNKSGGKVVDPATYFTSNDDYVVYLKGGEEAAFKPKEIVIDPNPFIKWNSQVDPNWEKFGGRDWMSGISGERYLNEINLPGTHDSCTKDMEGNVSTGYMSLIAGGLGVLIGTPIGLGAGLLVGAALPLLAADHFSALAETQVRYVDEQLADGIRSLDLRVNTYYSKKGYPPNRRDDGSNLWILHGKDKVGGSFFAKKENGDFLNLNDVFGYCKDFLEKHPTETIMIDIAIQGIDVDEDKALERLNRHIRRLSQEINPSTGESYLYMEDGDYMKVLDGYPQLKDCRGKIVLQGDTVGNGSGGLKSGAGLSAVYRPEGDFHDDSTLKIQHLKAFYGKYGYDPLPTDASNGKQVIDYYYSVGTNCTDPATVPQITPLDYAKDVLPVLFNDDDGLLIDRQGLFLGLVNMDAANAKNNRQVWITNFGKLEYCTVVSKEYPEDPNPKVYTVLKNTPIPIPECIYPDPRGGNYFEYWNATKGAGDTAGEFINSFYPGDSYTVTEDVTFTAVWEQNGASNIRVDWNDGNDADGLRPDTLSLTVTEDSSQDTRPAHDETVSAEGGWSKKVDYHVWRGDGTQQGITVNDCPDGYTYEVRGARITMTHAPEKSIDVYGQIDWRDEGDKAGIRPGRTTLKLYKNGEEKEEIEPTKEGGWNYSFGTLPLYEADSKGRYTRIAYRLEEDPIEGYSVYTSPVGDGKHIEVINTLVEHHRTVEGMVLWVDDDNEKGTRPEEVKVHLHAKGKEVGETTVRKDENGYWVFSFPMDQGVPFSGYSVTVDPIEDYMTQAYIEEIDGVAYIINTLNQHEHELKPIEGVSKKPTCIDEGVKTTFDLCLTCGKVMNRTDEIIPALGHDWGNWETVTESTETEHGLEQRVCDRDHSHIETREKALIGHRHDPQRVEGNEPTCTSPGNIPYYHCEGCGWNFLDGAHPGTTYLSEGEEVIPPLGHDWSDWETVKEATEDEPGLDKRSCRRDGCGAEETRETSKKTHIHDPKHVARKEATCEEPGNISYYYCEGCGWYFLSAAHPGTTWFEKGEEVIPAKGHVWGNWETVKEPTETEKGLEQRKCLRDPSHVQEREIPMHHTHDPQRVEAKAPTCTKEGNISYYYCEGCGWYFKDGAHPGTTWFEKGKEVIPALGHDWDKPSYTWADDLNTVTAKRVCKNDDSHFESETAETTYEVIKEPTADEDGEAVYTARFKNEGFETQTKTVAIPKTGATYYFFKGDGQTWNIGSKKTAGFRVKRTTSDETAFSHFTGIKVDGKAVDEKSYTKEPGSVIIKLKPSYLNKLGKGKHTITAEFDDGSADGIFYVADKGKNGGGARTGDEHNILIWLMLMLAALLGMSGYAVSRRRR